MRKYILGIFLLFGVFIWVSAQDYDDEVGNLGGKIQAQRVAFITDRMGLTPSESERFWALNNEYEDKQKTIRERYKPRKLVENMSDAEADQLINSRLDMESELLTLRREYVRRFREIVSPRKLVRFEKADREFKLFVLQKASERRQQNGRRQQFPGRRN